MRKIKKTKHIKVSQILTYFLIYSILISGAIIMLFPYGWMVTTSFKSQGEVFRFPPSLLPEHFTFMNYIEAWTSAPLGRFFLNSLFISIIVTAVVVIITSLAGYAFARLRFWGKKFIFYFLFTSLISPGFASYIPNFLLIKMLGLYNTYLALILPYIGWNIVLPTLLLKGFFLSIPSSLEDAAKIDGCSPLQIYYKIMLPLAKPGLITIAIFTWLFSWDEFSWALTATSSMDMRTMPVGMTLFQTQYYTLWLQLTAAAVMCSLPTIIFFVLLQKYFVPTLTFSAYKG